MRFSQIRKMDISNGPGIGASLFIQGCPIRCEGCFNPETGNFQDGHEFDFDAEGELLECLKLEQITRLSILGGEPLTDINIFELMMLCFDVKQHYPDIEIGLGSGYTGEQIEKRLKRAKDIWPKTILDSYLYPLLCKIDYIITGPFIEEEKDLTLKGRGSRNQEIIKCAESVTAGRKILYED